MEEQRWIPAIDSASPSRRRPTEDRSPHTCVQFDLFLGKCSPRWTTRSLRGYNAACFHEILIYTPYRKCRNRALFPSRSRTINPV